MYAMAEPELRAENSSGVGRYEMSGEDALSDRSLRRSSSSFFTLGKTAGKGNSLASPPYFCKVSLDAKGTGDKPLGEPVICLGSNCQTRPNLPACTRVSLVARSLMLLFHDRVPLLLSVLEFALLPRSLDAIISWSYPSTQPWSRARFLDSTPRALRALSFFLRGCISNNHPKGVLPSHILRIRGEKLGLTRR